MSAGPGGTAPAAAEPPRWLREVLRCPATGSRLEDRRDADGHLVGLLAVEADPPLLYPVVDGIPVLLVDEGVPQPPAGGSTADGDADGAPRSGA
ncbi:Trm112 family protein [Pseudokineococcus lusitanus]|uniref:Uncharacterized protein n=1 Tax=Pseudokineococcus lusitanus TaxID=763993 RepID=A0A3N1G903_9ACTN|nr:hypothetical protein [Pseudokineococcus lusitanus]ROP26730.1 hypothetical protein EDC03_3200 [Pseudokineococcus lusitanus]